MPCLADNTYIVDTLGDGGAGTLRAAITQMQASNGVQTIRFEIPGSAAIMLTSPLPALAGQSIVLDGSASPDLRINGAGWPMLKFLSGGSGQTIRFDHMNLRGGSNGDGGGCVDVKSAGTLLVFDSTFDSCFSSGPAASGSGGGAIRTNGSLRLTRTRFTNNASSDAGIVNLSNGGGAVSSSGSSVLIESTRFIGNHTDATPANATTCRGGSGGASHSTCRMAEVPHWWMYSSSTMQADARRPARARQAAVVRWPSSVRAATASPVLIASTSARTRPSRLAPLPDSACA